MDQGPIRRPPTPRWRLTDTLELAAAAGRQLVVGVALAVGAALVWSTMSSVAFPSVLPVTLVAGAAIMPMFTMVSARHDMAMHLDRLGQSAQTPDEEDIDGLTSVGTLLFVSLPLAVAATWLGI